LLERLDQPIQQDSIKAAVPELNATLVMFDEGVHSRPLLCSEIPGAYRYERLAEQPTLLAAAGEGAILAGQAEPQRECSMAVSGDSVA
jgi:hypothetical protein